MSSIISGRETPLTSLKMANVRRQEMYPYRKDCWAGLKVGNRDDGRSEELGFFVGEGLLGLAVEVGKRRPRGGAGWGTEPPIGISDWLVG